MVKWSHNSINGVISLTYNWYLGQNCGGISKNEVLTDKHHGVELRKESVLNQE